MSSDAAPAPVFVDDSGRRHRAVRVFGWLVGVVMVGYLALLAISLVGSPGLVPLSLPALGRILPGPGAPPIAGTSSRSHTRPELVVPTAAARTPYAGQPVVVPATPTAAARHAHGATPRPTTTTSATPRPTHTPQANPSPNRSARPSHGPATHPSPKNTKRSTASPSPTPTATAS